MMIQGVFLQVESLKHCKVGSIGGLTTAIDYGFEVVMFFLIFVRQNREGEGQRLFLIMVVALNISYCVFLLVVYGHYGRRCWPLRR